MKKRADPNIPKRDPIVDRPINTMRGRLLFGTLVIAGAAYFMSLINPLRHSPYFNGSYLGVILGIVIIGYLFFKYAHPLDQARWKHFRDGFFPGYLLIYLTFMLSLEHNEGLQAFVQTLQPDFVTKMIYACAAIYGWVTGFYMMANADPDEKFSQVCKLGDVRAIQPLGTYIRSGNVKYRRQAAVELGKLGDVRGVPSLLRGLRDRDSKVCVNSIKSLVKLDDIHAVKPMITTLQYGKPRVQREAAKALGSMYKTRAVEPLIETLKVSKKGFVRASIVDALGNLEDVRALEALTEALHDRNWGVRLAANEAIKKLTWRPEAIESNKIAPPATSQVVVENDRRQPGQTQAELPTFLAQPVSAMKQGETSQVEQATYMGVPTTVEARRQRSRFSLPAFIKGLVCNQKQPKAGKVSRRAAAAMKAKPERRGVFAFLKRKPRTSKRSLRRSVEEAVVDEQTEAWEVSQPEAWEVSQPEAPARPADTPAWSEPWQGAQVAPSGAAMDSLAWGEELEYEAPDPLSEAGVPGLEEMPSEVELQAYQETESTCPCDEPSQEVAFSPPSMHEF